MLNRFLEQLKDYYPHIIAAVIVLILGIILTKIITQLLIKGKRKSKIDPIAQSFLQSIIKTVLYILIAITVLSTLQVPMSSIIATVGAAGVAIALSLQGSLSNVAGGFIIMFTHPFKCGDYVEINGVSGSVDAITILNTRLLTIDNKAVLIPNGSITANTIINYTQENLRRLELHFAIDYNCDYKKAEQIIHDVIDANPLTLDAPDKPFITICEHAESAIILLVRVWVKTKDYWELNYQLLEQVKDKFDENNIVIPYNQLDVHVHKE